MKLGIYQIIRPAGSFWTALMAAALLCGARTHAAVSADPAAVLFNSLHGSSTVKLLKDGALLPPAEIRGWRLLASGHAYNHMLKLEKTENGITISPAAMEVGSYELIIDTASGQAIVQVLAPLADVPGTLEKQAEVLGISLQQLKERLGFVKPLERGRQVRIELPPVYYEGQTLELSMPLAPELVYVWKINGETVKQGPGENELAYTFPAPGEYCLEYEEQAGGAVIARAQSSTAVKALGPVPAKAAATQEQTFTGPEGYGAYVWTVDGEARSNEKVFRYRFMAPGIYKVECTATQPVSGPATGFLRQPYEVAVSSRK